jgi:hypothetical protein
LRIDGHETLLRMNDDPRLLALRGEQPSALAVRGDEMANRRSDLDAFKNGAAMLTQAGNRVAALALLWSAVAIEPTDLGSHRRLAATLFNGGDVDGAANEYARYIEFMLPLGDVGRATMELAYGVKMLGGHRALQEAAEKIASAIRSLVPAVVETLTLPVPRLLPKVPFRFCVHDDGNLHWMQLEGGTDEVAPNAVRMLDREDSVVETRKCIALAPGQKGHARVMNGEATGVAWVVLGIPTEMVTALDEAKPSPYRFEAQVGEEWLSTDLVDTGCRLGRVSATTVAS